MDRFHGVRRHLESPSCSNLRGLITDVVSILEDQQNYFESLLTRKLEKFMSALSDQLTAAVASLTASVATHDEAVTAALKNLANLSTQGEAVPSEAVQAAIDQITQAKTKLQDETTALNAAMPAAVQQASAAAVQDAAPASPTGTTIQENAVAAANAADAAAPKADPHAP